MNEPSSDAPTESITLFDTRSTDFTKRWSDSLALGVTNFPRTTICAVVSHGVETIREKRSTTRLVMRFEGDFIERLS
jgi:hypothetical protein